MWKVWSDPNNWNTWNTGIRKAELDGPLVSGATGKMETTRGSKHSVTFTEVLPERRFLLNTSGLPLTTFTFICEVDPEGSGSRIAQSVAFSGPLAFLFSPLMGERMASNFVPVLDGLAEAAEREAG